MAYIGMRHPVFAPLSSHTEGQPITYGTGMVVGYGVVADLTIQTSDNKDYGSDLVVASDAGINGLTLSFETNDLAKEVRTKLLGYVPVTSNSTVTHYRVTGTDAPVGGFGWVNVKEAAGTGTVTYEAFFVHKIKFQPTSVRGATKTQQKEYQHMQLTGTGLSANLYGDNYVDWYFWMEFATEAEAEAWLDDLANVPAAATT